MVAHVLASIVMIIYNLPVFKCSFWELDLMYFLIESDDSQIHCASTTVSWFQGYVTFRYNLAFTDEGIELTLGFIVLG